MLAVKRRFGSKKLSPYIAYVVTAGLIAGLIAIGDKTPSAEQSASLQQSAVALQSSRPTIDQVTTAELAAVAAQTADLAIAGDVTTKAAYIGTTAEIAQADSQVITMPKIVNGTGSTRGIQTYQVVAGDTVQSLALKFGVSEDSIRWSNSLVGSNLPAGRDLLIPGTTGVIYTVQPGDTPEKLAAKFKADPSRIVTYNDAELTGLGDGQKIVIPGGIMPEEDRPGSQGSLAGAATSRTLLNIKTNNVTAAPVGYVKAGDIIGYVGSTGFSTGPHAHLEARLNSRIVDPNPYFFSNEWMQPVIAPISQSYGNPSSWYTRGYHPGTDYAAQMGTPMRAVADGMLYRGCTSAMFGAGYGNAYGYVAVIDHGNGLQSLYGHMQAGPDGAACNY